MADAVCHLVACSEHKSGKLVKAICTNNGNEFVNTVIRKFCLMNGIRHETTNTYCPEQNGITERAITVFMEMTQCMLHCANMDLCYWGKVFMYTIYILSITPTSGLDRKIPYTKWNELKKKPDISHLQIFGSLGWAYVLKEVWEGKLESRAVRVCMLGQWADETKGSRLEDLENGKLITSRDVQFCEDTTPSELACMEVGLTHSSDKEINDFIDEAVYPKSDIPQQVSIPSELSKNEVVDMLEESNDSQMASTESTPISDLRYAESSHPVTPLQTPVVEVPLAP